MPEQAEKIRPFVAPQRKNQIKIEVYGGAGGTAANLADLEAAGRLLKAAGKTLDGVWADAVASADAGLVDTDALACPQTAADVAWEVAKVTAGPLGLLTTGSTVYTLGGSVGLCEEAYDLHERVTKSGFVEMIKMGGPQGMSTQLGARTVVSGGLILARVLLGKDAIPEGSRAWDLAPVDSQLAHAATGTLVANGAVAGLAPEETFERVAGGAGRLGYDETPVVLHRPQQIAAPGTPARNTQELLAQTHMPDDSRPGGDHQLRLNRVKHADGTYAWIVVIPGTQNFGPTKRETSSDMTSNMRYMAGLPSEEGKAITQALEERMRAIGADPSKEPVMLVGHSHGGIAASYLARDADFNAKFKVRNVLTAGSPIARMPPPDHVHTLAIEHDQDNVAALDGLKNPDRPNVVTVHRDLVSSPRADAGALLSEGSIPAQGVTHSHELDGYLETAGAVDEDQRSSVVRWREQAEPFLNAESQESWNVDMTRASDGYAEAAPSLGDRPTVIGDRTDKLIREQRAALVPAGKPLLGDDMTPTR